MAEQMSGQMRETMENSDKGDFCNESINLHNQTAFPDSLDNVGFFSCPKSQVFAIYRLWKPSFYSALDTWSCTRRSKGTLSASMRRSPLLSGSG